MIDEAAIPPLLDTFYARVRADPLIGPIFNDAVHDWDEHLARIGEFWSSVMLGSGRYKGNPVARHLAHAVRIEPGMFDRWLALWAQTTDDMLPSEEAQAMQAKAARIAESLQLAMQFASAQQRAMIEGGTSPRG